MKFLKNRFALPVAGLFVALMLFGATHVMASRPGFNSNLSPWQAHNTIVAGKKDFVPSTNAYVFVNKNMNNAWYWVDRVGNGQVTAKIFVGGGKQRTLPYEGLTGWTGDVKLRAHQEFWGPGTDHVSGWVNFDAGR